MRIREHQKLSLAHGSSVVQYSRDVPPQGPSRCSVLTGRGVCVCIAAGLAEKELRRHERIVRNFPVFPHSIVWIPSITTSGLEKFMIACMLLARIAGFDSEAARLVPYIEDGSELLVYVAIGELNEYTVYSTHVLDKAERMCRLLFYQSLCYPWSSSIGFGGRAAFCSLVNCVNACNARFSAPDILWWESNCCFACSTVMVK